MDFLTLSIPLNLMETSSVRHFFFFSTPIRDMPRRIIACTTTSFYNTRNKTGTYKMESILSNNLTQSNFNKHARPLVNTMQIRLLIVTYALHLGLFTGAFSQVSSFKS